MMISLAQQILKKILRKGPLVSTGKYIRQTISKSDNMTKRSNYELVGVTKVKSMGRFLVNSNLILYAEFYLGTIFPQNFQAFTLIVIKGTVYFQTEILVIL